MMLLLPARVVAVVTVFVCISYLSSAPTRVKIFCATLEKIYAPHEYLTMCGTCNIHDMPRGMRYKGWQEGGGEKSNAGRCRCRLWNDATSTANRVCTRELCNSPHSLHPFQKSPHLASFYFHRCLLTFSLLLLLLKLLLLLLLIYRKCYLRSINIMINIIIVSLASDLELRLCKTSPKCAKEPKTVKLQANGLQTVKAVANSPS